MTSITIALPDYLMMKHTITPSEVRDLLHEAIAYYECDIKDKEPIMLYTDKVTKFTLRLDDNTANSIKKYAKQLNITILMFTACLVNMYVI